MTKKALLGVYSAFFVPFSIGRFNSERVNKKNKTVKDKRKSTGERSDEIKSFPEFTDLDELWRTRDTVTNKYVVEAGSNDQPIDETSTGESDHDQSEEEDLSFDVPQSFSLRRKRKQPLKEAQTAPPVTRVNKTKCTTMSNEAQVNEARCQKFAVQCRFF